MLVEKLALYIALFDWDMPFISARDITRASGVPLLSLILRVLVFDEGVIVPTSISFHGYGLKLPPLGSSVPVIPNRSMSFRILSARKSVFSEDSNVPVIGSTVTLDNVYPESGLIVI